MCFKPLWRNRSVYCPNSDHGRATNGGPLCRCGKVSQCPGLAHTVPVVHFYNAPCPLCVEEHEGLQAQQAARQQAIKVVEAAAKNQVQGLLQAQAVLDLNVFRLPVQAGGLPSQNGPELLTNHQQ